MLFKNYISMNALLDSHVCMHIQSCLSVYLSAFFPHDAANCIMKKHVSILINNNKNNTTNKFTKQKTNLSSDWTKSIGKAENQSHC